MKVGDCIRTLGGVFEGLTRDTSGTTVSVRAGAALPFVDGYIVGGSGVETLVLPAGTVPNFLAVPEDYGALTGWLRDLPMGTLHVGAWLHEGCYHFDVVDIYSDRTTALKIAAERGEYAIYDGIKMTTIAVREPED